MYAHVFSKKLDDRDAWCYNRIMPDYKFTETWFTLDRKESGGAETHHERWTRLFQHHKETSGAKIQSVLEVGCYEGRASTWICENLLGSEGGRLDVIDTFGGSDCEAGMDNAKKLLKENQNHIREAFDHNLSFFPHIDLHIHEGLSQEVLPQLVHADPLFLYDFIYIDGSHNAGDTFIDAYYANKLLKPEGVLIFDDYLWKDPARPAPIDSPMAGINFHSLLYSDKYTLLDKGYQLFLIKNK